MLMLRSWEHTFVLRWVVEEVGAGLLGSRCSPAPRCPSPIWFSGALCWRKGRRRRFLLLTQPYHRTGGNTYWIWSYFLPQVVFLLSCHWLHAPLATKRVQRSGCVRCTEKQGWGTWDVLQIHWLCGHVVWQNYPLLVNHPWWETWHAPSLKGHWCSKLLILIQMMNLLTRVLQNLL